VRPHVAGIVRVVRAAYPDHTAWDSADPHYDARSSESEPRWHMVDVRLVRKFAVPVSLDALKARPELADMALLRRPRISVVGVSAREWQVVCEMAGDSGVED
jgi:predicted RNA-binding protein with PUA-like domain